MSDSQESSPPRVALAPIAFVYIALAVLAGLGVFALFRAASPMMTTIGIGVVLALALDPVVCAIRRRWHWHRAAAALFVMGGVIGMALVLLVVMGPRAVLQAQRLSGDIPGTVREFYTLPVVGRWLERSDAVGKVDNAVERLPSQISDKEVRSVVQSVVGGAVRVLVVLAVAMATLIDGERLIGRARALVPTAWLPRADEIGRVFYVAIARYFSGSLSVAVLMGVVVLALCLVFSVPLAPLAAIWATLTDMVPQVGGFLGGALLGLLALTRGPFIFVVVVGLYVLYMNLENHVISPAVVGPAVGVTPPTTMLAALLGGAVAGVPGALVATPCAGAVKQLYLMLRWGQKPSTAEEAERLAHGIGRLRTWRQRRRDATGPASE